MKDHYLEVRTTQRPRDYVIIFDAELDRMRKIETDPRHDSRIYQEVIIQNKKFKALIDTLSDIAFYNAEQIDPEADLKVKVKKKKILIKGIGGLSEIETEIFQADVAHPSNIDNIFTLTFYSLPPERFPSTHTHLPFVLGHEFCKNAGLQLLPVNSKTQREAD